MSLQTPTARARPLALWLIMGVGGLVVALLLSMAVGAKHIPFDEVLRLLGRDGGGEDGAIVNGTRLSRTLHGLVAGIAVGVAGALMQGLTRNPIADPGLLGVSAGASLGVVLTTTMFGVTALHGYIWFAFAGALAATVLVYAIGGGTSPTRLALSGAAVTALLQSVISAALLFDESTLDTYRFWAVGSIARPDTTALVDVLPFLVIGLALAVSVAPGMNLLALGDDVAAGLGQRTNLVRLRGAVAVTLLTGGATAVCGPLAFVGLAVPHIARLLTGPDQRWVLACSALLAPTLLLLADVAGRLTGAGEVPVGVVCAFVGTPFFIALVRKRKLPEL